MVATKTKPEAEPQLEEPQLSYEQAREELIEVVNRLESGAEPLADSMDLYKRGEYLAEVCERYLTQARSLVEDSKI